MSAPANVIAFETFLNQWVIAAPKFSGANNAYVNLDLSRFKVEEINFDYLLTKIQEWVSAKVVVDPTRPMFEHGTIAISFRLGNANKEILEKLGIFFTKLSLPLKVSVSFNGENNFESVDPRIIMAFITDLTNHPQITSINLGDSGLWGLEPPVLRELLQSSKPRTKTSYNATKSCSISEPTRVSLWSGHSAKLKPTTEKWPRKRCVDFAVMHLEMLALSNGGYFYGNPFPFALNLDEYKEVFQAYLKENAMPAEVIQGLLSALNLTDEERSTLSAFLAPLIFRSFSTKLLQNTQGPFSIDISRFPWETIDVDALLTTLRTVKFQENYNCTLMISGTELNTDKLQIIIKFLDGLRDFHRAISLIICDNGQALIKDDILLALVNYISKHSKIISCQWQGGKLWRLSPKTLHTVHQIATSQLNPNAGIRLWSNMDPAFLEDSKNWNEAERTQLIQLCMQQEEHSDGSWSTSPFFSFELSMQDYLKIFGQYLAKKPEHAPKVLGWAQHCKLPPNETNAELLKELTKHQMRLASDNIHTLDLNTFAIQTEDDLIKLLEELERTSFLNLCNLSLDITEIPLEKLPLYLRLIKGIEARISHQFGLTLKDASFAEDDCKKIISFIKSIMFSKLRELTLSNLDLEKVHNSEGLLILAEAIASNRHIGGISLLNTNLGNILFVALEKFLATLFSRIYKTVNLSNNQFSNLTSAQLLLLIQLINSDNLVLADNKIEERSLETLLEINQLMRARSHDATVASVFLWHAHHFRAAKEPQLPALSSAERLAIARIFFEVELYSPYFTNDNQDLSWLLLEEGQYFELIQSCIQKMGSSGPCTSKIMHWIKNTHFSYEHRLQLACEYVRKVEYIHSIKEFNLRSRDCLQLFIDTGNDNDFEMVGKLKGFNLLPDSAPSLSTSSSLGSSTLSSSPTDEEPLKASLLFQAWLPLAEIEEEEVQFMPEVMQQVFAALHSACRTIWNDNNFYEDSLQAMRKWPTSDPYQVFKLLNMVKWFTCTAALLTTYPDINLSAINKALNEIRGYPDPSVRNRATIALVDKLYQHPAGPGLYKSLCEKASGQLASHLLIPAIFLSQIVLEGAEDFQKSPLTVYNGSPHRLDFAIKLSSLKERAHNVLLNIPAFYKDGHYFRQMVAALQVIADYQKMPATTKLMLIENAFGIQQSLKDRREIEGLLKAFVNKAASSLKPELDKLSQIYQSEFDVWCRNLLEDPAISMGTEKQKFENAVAQKRQEKSEILHSLVIGIRAFIQEINAMVTDPNISREMAIATRFETFAQQQALCVRYLHVVLWEEIVSNPVDGMMRTRSRKDAQLAGSALSSSASSSAPQTLATNNKPVILTDKLLNEKCKILIRTLQNKATECFLEEEQHIQQSHWLLLQSLELWPHIEQLKDAQRVNFDFISQQLRIQYFDLSASELQYFENRFGSRHNNTALFTYLNKIRLLPGSQRGPMEALFLRIIKAILTENSEQYFALRYNETLNNHLRQIFEGRAVLKEAWRKGASVKLKHFIEQHPMEAEPFVPDYADIFHKRIFLHQHLPAQHYQDFRKYLEAKKRGDVKGCSEIERQLEESTAKIADSSIRQAPSPIPMLRAKVQLGLIKLSNVKVGPETKKEELRLLLSIKKAFHSQLWNEGREFIHDLEMLLNNLRSGTTKEKEIDPAWTLVDTDDYWSAFMVGTDVEGSCQRVDGSPSLNKCLLAYVIDGKNRILAIQDETGVTIARCILRMLWDPIAKKPVLFQEDIYPDAISMQPKLALIEFAKHRAEALGLTLVSSKSNEQVRKYVNSLAAMGSIAPWEYVDALHSAQSDGTYVIDSAEVIYSPDLVKVENIVSEYFPFSTAMAEMTPVMVGKEQQPFQPPFNAAELLGTVIEYFASDDGSYDKGVGVYTNSDSSQSSPVLFSQRANVATSSTSAAPSTVRPDQHAESSSSRDLEGDRKEAVYQ